MRSSGSGSGISSSKMERKDKERERRQQMKELCFKLSSLIPATPNSSTSKDMMTQHDSLDEAATYISELKQRVEKLRELRDSKYPTRGIKRSTISPRNQTTNRKTAPPVIEVRSEDTNLEVVIVSGLDDRFELHRVIGILDEEGADVKNANVSVVGDRMFYTIHSQALSSRIGFEASRVLERLQDLVNS